MMKESSGGKGQVVGLEGAGPNRQAGSGGGAGTDLQAERRGGGRERATAPPAAAGEDRRGGGQLVRRGADPSAPEPRAKRTEEEQRWAENWRANEIRLLHGAVADLERRLRHRTVALIAALAFGGVAAVAGFIGVMLGGPGPAAPPPRVAEAPGGTPPEGLRADLAAAAERTEELEGTIADYEATVARLRAELAGSRDEVGDLREQLEVSRRGIERLNATLARATDRAGVTASRPPPEPGTAAVESAGTEETEDAAGRSRAGAVVVARGPGGVSREGIGQGGQDDAGGLGEAGAGSRTLREVLAEFNRQAEATSAADSADGTRAVEPRSRPDASQPEVAAPGESPDAGRREAEGRNASTAARGVETASEAAAPAGRGGDGTRTGGAERFTATTPVNMRAAPSNDADVVAVVEEGDTVRSIGRRGGWLRVEYANAVGERSTGWVYNRYLRRAEAPSGPGAPSAGDGG